MSENVRPIVTAACGRTACVQRQALTENRAGTDSGMGQHGGMEDVSYAIETHGLVKRFGKTTALAGVDLTARTGSVLGLLGPNGAGKTTAVRILATLLRPDDGIGDRLRLRRGARRAPGAPAHRAHRPVRLGRRGAVGHQQPDHGRPAARAQPAAGPRPRGRAARAVRAHRRRRAAARRPTRAACAAASTWPPAWSAGRACSTSTSRPPASTRTAATRSGA